MTSTSIPIANLEQTVGKLEDVSLFRNFVIKVFNPMVEQCYWDSSGEHKTARAALKIKSTDSQISILNKQILFWQTLGKYSHESEEKIYVGKPYHTKTDEDYDNLYAKIRLVPRDRFVDGLNVGYRYIQVPHVDAAKLGNLRNFEFKFGRFVMSYVFADKRKIKLHAYSEELGHKAINELLKLVYDKNKVGSSEEHSSVVKIGKDVRDLDLHGRVAYGKALILTDFGGLRKFTIFI